MAGKKRRTDPGPEEKKEEDTDISNPSQRRRFMGQQMGQQQQRQQEGEQLRSPRPEAWRSEMHRIAVDRLNDRTHRSAKALRDRTFDSAHLLRAGLNKILNDYKFSLRAIDNEFILKPGFVAATGNGEQGELGIAEEEEMEKATKGHSALYKPQPVESLNGKGIIKIRSSGQFSVALAACGLVYVWGCNDEGQLGVLDTTNNSNVSKVSEVFVPRRLKGFLPALTSLGIDFFGQPEESIVDVALGECHAMYLSSTGKVFFVGAFRIKSQGRKFRPVPHRGDPRIMTYEPDLRSSEDIELNKPPEQAPFGTQWYPTEVWLPNKATKIWSTATGCFALLEDGTLWSWGFSQFGELGRKAEVVPGTSRDDTRWLETIDALRESATPRKIEISCGANVKEAWVENVGCGEYHTVFTLREFCDQYPGGRLVTYSMGKNVFGQLGQGTTSQYDNPTPKRIIKLDGCDIAQASGGVDFTVLLDSSGTRLLVCGDGKDSLLGTTDANCDDYQEMSPVPCLLEGVSKSNPPVKSVDCGETHTIVICENGSAYSWGHGESGALGHGRSGLGNDISVVGFDVPRPKKITTKKRVNFLMAACGTHHSLLLFTNDE